MRDLRNLIVKYNKAIPRYTSYPPANLFKDNFQENEYLEMIEESNGTGIENIAFYIHIPFCHQICFYCGCNAMRGKNQQQVDDYVQAVKKEIRMVASRLDKKRKVSQIHYGGGTPNSIDVRYLEEINQLIFDLFEFIPQTEVAIECHPGYLDELYLHRLMNARFNRFSLGIQDFNQEVLDNVNRKAAAMPLKDIVKQIRDYSPMNTVNLDFIYGLPGQTVEKFNDTIQKAIEIQPDRLVTFSYAHVPWLKKHQQILEKKGLLNSDEKFDLFMSSRKLLLDSGYMPVGLDHYVKSTDELNLALQENRLHRNFQGYCSRRTTGQVYAFGVSGISQLENGFVQNLKEVDKYIALISKGHLPVEKGYVLTREDKIIKTVIEQVMCNKVLDLDAVLERFDLNMEEFRTITGFMEESLSDFIDDDLIRFDGHVLEILEEGSLFIRNIATLFDPALMNKEKLYSKSI